MPDKSKAEAKKMFVLEREGKVAAGTAREFLHSTPGGYKGLPEHVKKKRLVNGVGPAKR